MGLLQMQSFLAPDQQSIGLMTICYNRVCKRVSVCRPVIELASLGIGVIEWSCWLATLSTIVEAIIIYIYPSALSCRW